MVSLRARASPSSASAASVSEELLVAFHDAVCRVDAIELVNALVAGVRGAGAARPLPAAIARWDVGAAAAGVADAACVGGAPAGAFEAQAPRGRFGVVAVGVSPFAAAFECDEEERASVVGALASKVGDVASNVGSSVGSAAGGVASRVLSLASGLLGHTPAQAAAAATARAAEAMAGKASGQGGGGGEGAGGGEDEPPTARRMRCVPTARLDDGGRQALRLAQAPRGPMLAAADSLGRVTLLDGRSLAALRMWKGAYRDAHCAFAEAPPADAGADAGRGELMLAVLAPLRRVVELWPVGGAHADEPLAEADSGGAVALLPLAPTLCAWSAAGAASGDRATPSDGSSVAAIALGADGQLSALRILRGG